MMAGYIEAIPHNPSNPLFVYEGESFGFSIIDRNIRIFVDTNNLPGEGIHKITQSQLTNCSGITTVEYSTSLPLSMIPSIVVRLTNGKLVHMYKVLLPFIIIFTCQKQLSKLPQQKWLR